MKDLQATRRVWRGFLFIVLLTSSHLIAANDSGDTPVASDSSTLVAENFSNTEFNQGKNGDIGTGIMSQEMKLENQATPALIEEIKHLTPFKSANEVVLGTDTRSRTYALTYPARAIALITFNGGWCTGTFYGPNVVLTAGHCVHAGKGGTWRTNVRVWPGYDAGSAPYGSFAAKTLHSVTGWTNDSNEQFDYGVIKLSVNAGNTVGWYGYFWQDASLNGLPSIIAGYPGDKSPTQSQWIGSDIVRFTQLRQVFYKNDTADGMSGSAVWQDRPAGSPFCSNGPCIYAIHAYGLHGTSPHSDHNHGTRITQNASNNLTTWNNEL